MRVFLLLFPFRRNQRESIKSILFICFDPYIRVIGPLLGLFNFQYTFSHVLHHKSCISLEAIYKINVLSPKNLLSSLRGAKVSSGAHCLPIRRV